MYVCMRLTDGIRALIRADAAARLRARFSLPAITLLPSRLQPCHHRHVRLLRLSCRLDGARLRLPRPVSGSMLAPHDIGQQRTRRPPHRCFRCPQVHGKLGGTRPHATARE